MADVNTEILEKRIDDALAKRMAKGGGGGYDGTMFETRVASLESDMKDVKASLAKIVAGLAGIEGKLSNMPTTFQVLTWFVGVAIGLTALVFAIARTVSL